jgi:hypothetical protein
MTNINCTQFRSPNKCVHQGAPRRLLGCAKCVLAAWPSSDPRVVVKCALQTPHVRVNPPKAP